MNENWATRLINAGYSIQEIFVDFEFLEALLKSEVNFNG